MCLYVSVSCNTAHCDALQHTTFVGGAGCAFMCLYPATQHIATHYSTLHSCVECDGLYVLLCAFVCLYPATQHMTTHYITFHSYVECDSLYVPSCSLMYIYPLKQHIATHYSTSLHSGMERDVLLYVFIL